MDAMQDAGNTSKKESHALEVMRFCKVLVFFFFLIFCHHVRCKAEAVCGCCCNSHLMDTVTLFLSELN